MLVVLCKGGNQNGKKLKKNTQKILQMARQKKQQNQKRIPPLQQKTRKKIFIFFVNVLNTLVHLK